MYNRPMQYQAFVIEAGAEEGIKCAEMWAAQNLGMDTQGNPDFVVLRHGLFSVADARRVSELAAGAAFAGAQRVLVIAAQRAYHEAQNALLKLFEEPPRGTSVFLILPTLGGLLPTLRSRVQILISSDDAKPAISEMAEEFLKASREKRTALIKKLTSGKDDEDRQERRDDAIQILNGIEAVAYAQFKKDRSIAILLSEIATLRGYLYDRSAPIRMILEHLSLVLPKNLSTTRQI